MRRTCKQALQPTRDQKYKKEKEKQKVVQKKKKEWVDREKKKTNFFELVPSTRFLLPYPAEKKINENYAGGEPPGVSQTFFF